MSRKDPNRLTGRQKAAILMISLGLDVSASVYKHLSEDEIEKLTLEISNVRSVDTAKKMKSSKSFTALPSRRTTYRRAVLCTQDKCLKKRLVRIKRTAS